MNGLDTLAGILLGAYLLTVAVKGKTPDMITLAKRDKAFIQWALAVSVLFYLYKFPALRPIMGELIFAGFVGLGLIAGPKIVDNVKLTWGSLK